MNKTIQIKPETRYLAYKSTGSGCFCCQSKNAIARNMGISGIKVTWQDSARMKTVLEASNRVIDGILSEPVQEHVNLS
jgi:hypothetical protein